MSEKENHNAKNEKKCKIVPHHLSIIMDGNGRWAKKHNLPRFAGHQAGVKTVRMIITESIKAGVKLLTLYAFSTENWKRSKREINSLMNLFQDVIKKEKKSLVENQIKVKFIGHRDSLSAPLQLAMEELEDATKNYKKLQLNIGINYGGRSELCHAFQSILQQIREGNIKSSQIDQSLVSQHLFTAGLPDPDLLIRTGGEKRISNFLLWQIAYTELWFTKMFWPDFSKEDLWKAFNDYEKRVRKFGGEV